MKNIPITFHYALAEFSEKTRSFIMREFASNGAKHLILGDGLFLQIMQDFSMEKKLLHEMEEAGLSFVDGHAPFGEFLDMNCPDVSRRKEMIARHKLALNIAANMGIKTLTIHCGVDFPNPDIPTTLHVSRVKEALEKILPEAEKCDVIVAIENIWTPNCQPDVLLDIKKDFPTEYLGFCYDSGHANLIDGNHVPRDNNRTEGDWRSVTKSDIIKWEDKALEKMLPHVVTCHLHDNDGVDDRHWRIGKGNVDWKHIKSLLMQAPKLQCIQSEVQAFRANASIKELCEDMQFFCNLEC